MEMTSLSKTFTMKDFANLLTKINGYNIKFNVEYDKEDDFLDIYVKYDGENEGIEYVPYTHNEILDMLNVYFENQVATFGFLKDSIFHERLVVVIFKEL